MNESPSIAQAVRGGFHEDEVEAAPAIVGALADLALVLDALEKVESVVRDRFTHVVAQQEPMVAATPPDAVKSRGSSRVHNDLAEAVERIQHVTRRLDEFSSRSEVK